MTASEIAARETLSFVVAHLPRRNARVLEIGCGAGELAARLSAAGHRVVAIDSDPDAIREAKARGVDARRAEWPDYDDKPFDALLFTRSLHHMTDLEGSLERAAEMLVDGGRLILEEFAWEDMDQPTCAWWSKAIEGLAAARMLDLERDSLVRRFQSGGADLLAWRREYEGDIEPREAMNEILRESFAVRAESRAPYLYRGLLPILPQNETGARLGQRTLEAEARLGQAGTIRLVGWRAVAETLDR